MPREAASLALVVTAWLATGAPPLPAEDAARAARRRLSSRLCAVRASFEVAYLRTGATRGVNTRARMRLEQRTHTRIRFEHTPTLARFEKGSTGQNTAPEPYDKREPQTTMNHEQ